MLRNPTDLGFLPFGIYELYQNVRSVEPDDLHRSYGTRPELVPQELHARVGRHRHGDEPRPPPSGSGRGVAAGA
jgi:hypothetical protein